MEDENKDNKVGPGLKLAMTGVVAFIVLVLLAITVLPMLQTVGGSFGYGFPGGSGGRAIRDVEIDVDPQIVYRIDDHRFFTLEKYIDCMHGGFVYYNDTNKKIKVFAGIEDEDKKTQNEFTITKPNSVMAFNSKFIYSASDNIIAYPGRNVSYKYGYLNDFVVLKVLDDSAKNTGFKVSGSGYDSITTTDNAIYIQESNRRDIYQKHSIPKKTDRPEWVSASNIHFANVSQDDHFHCNKNIKPQRIKYISN